MNEDDRRKIFDHRADGTLGGLRVMSYTGFKTAIADAERLISTPNILGYSMKGWLFVNSRGFLVGVPVQTDSATLAEVFHYLPTYNTYAQALEANPYLKPGRA